ncbi:hypothetical protein GZH53_03195 [Flavihumibacter sp. R14]|nr:hypothetical protein [Flavihumibacter soli]
MTEKGKEYILAVRKSWRFNLVLSGILIALGCTALVISILYRGYGISFLWALPLFASFLVAVLTIQKPWSIRTADVSRFLNERFPELEESSQLFLKPQDSLNFLENIQASRIAARLSSLPGVRHRALMIRFIASLFVFMIAALICMLPSDKNVSPVSQQTSAESISPMQPEILPAKVQSATITIVPPAYTRKRVRNQEQFSLLAEAGSLVTWKVQTNEPVKELSFIFNDRERLKLQPLNPEKTLWQLSKVIQQPGFYQVKVNEQLSDLYQVQTIRDNPAFIRIIIPKQYTTIDFGEPQRTAVKISITDDYGVKGAVIMATTASGKGEGVKFTEKQLTFDSNFKALNRSYNLQKNIDLKSLGMVPGDELYFYVKALDNLNQESRSETYFVSIQDTAELMSMDGMTSGVNLVPEYFRSMRQIIIDTEKLIKDRSSISTEDFNSRSNNLGIDQKLLRLRYGKFLGEEGGEDDHDEHPADDPAAFGNTDAILNEFGHNHDNAEDATFFEPELKSQLKATLTEMWNSEQRLRTNRPSEALPYEYKALRLLKDLQQKSRVYVAKTAIKTPPLKEKTRLSGELDKIINPFNTGKFPAVTDPYSALRQTSGVIDKLKEIEMLSRADRMILAEANKILSNKAVANPSVYLGAVIVLRKLISNENYLSKPEELMMVEKALQKAITGTLKIPQAMSSDATSGLSEQYLKNLSRLQR